MLEITILQTYGWKAAIRGMRNPMNSWDKSDTILYKLGYYGCDDCPKKGEDCSDLLVTNNGCLEIGPNDLDLACRLIKAGPEHCKFLRMIHVQMNIKAPLYWWKEMDTYKVGTTANSCSTMHKIAAKKFTLEDFSCEHLDTRTASSLSVLEAVIAELNHWRNNYLVSKSKEDWWQMIQLLPSSYNQLRTWDASLQAILNILHQRKGHKLDEWHTFRRICFEQIPYCKEFYTAMTGDKELWD